MGSGVEATAHLAEVEFRSQGQYRTRIRRTNRSLSAILAAHDFDMPHNCIAAPPSVLEVDGKVSRVLNVLTLRWWDPEWRNGVKHRGWGGGERSLANAMRFTKGHFLSEKMISVKYLYPTENMIP